MRQATREDETMNYQNQIRVSMNDARYDPRHIEAFMRVDHNTLDKFTSDEWRREIKLCKACVDECGAKQAEKIAQSFGL